MNRVPIEHIRWINEMEISEMFRLSLYAMSFVYDNLDFRNLERKRKYRLLPKLFDSSSLCMRGCTLRHWSVLVDYFLRIKIEYTAKGIFHFI